MGKYRMTEPYGYGEPIGFDSLRSAVDSELANNKTTDAQQTEDIQKESQINEEQAQQIADIQTVAEEAQAVAEEAKTAAEGVQAVADEAKTTADEAKAAVEDMQTAVEDAQTVAEEAKTTADEAKDAAESAQTVADEAKTTADEAKAAIDVLNGEGDGSVKKTVDEAVAPYFDGAEYDSDAKKIVFKHGDEVKAEIDATDFLKDGMIDTVVIEDGKLVITFNTESGKENIEIPISDIFNADNYYTKDEVDTELSKKVDWTESTPGRNHIVLKNHDSILGTATDGTTYNVAMVSKWDVADFGSVSLHLNLNSKNGVATINDNKQIATVDDITTTVSEMVGDTEVLNEISDSAVIDGDDIILSGGGY